MIAVAGYSEVDTHPEDLIAFVNVSKVFAFLFSIFLTVMNFARKKGDFDA